MGGFIMGIPISSYTVLKYLADGVENRQRNLEMDVALEALEDYSVFAFVLYDPLEHKEFKEFFENQFKNFHYATGEHLVFFGLVDSPEKYSLMGQKPFYEDVRELIDSYESQEHSSYTAFALANNLRLTSDMLPAIIVTHDTRLRSFQWYKTCPDKMELQMGRLARIAQELSLLNRQTKMGLVDKQEALFELLKDQDLDLCNGSGEEKLNETIARALSDILSFAMDHCTDLCSPITELSKEQRKQSYRKAIYTLTFLKSKLQISEKDTSDYYRYIDLIEELSIKIGTFLALLQKQKNSLSPFNSGLIENDSLHLLQTGLDVQSFLQNKHTNTDYSASAICFAKMFEQEINYSFVHWIRNQININLPEFFNKKQPGKAAIYNNIDFNKGIRGKWQAPELGRSKYIARNNIKTSEWTAMGIQNPSLFLNRWEIIHTIRNRAAHTEKISLSDVNEIKDSLFSLANDKIFTQLAYLKNRYNGRSAQ